MNKKLFEKVKGLCKDTGLSEKYLKAITEKMGGSIEDDSTDDEAIESTANLIAEVAKESQGEATRWANKKKPTQTEDEEEEERKRKEEESKRKGKVAFVELLDAQDKVVRKRRIDKGMADFYFLNALPNFLCPERTRLLLVQA